MPTNQNNYQIKDFPPNMMYDVLTPYKMPTNQNNSQNNGINFDAKKSIKILEENQNIQEENHDFTPKVSKTLDVINYVISNEDAKLPLICQDASERKGVWEPVPIEDANEENKKVSDMDIVPIKRVFKTTSKKTYKLGKNSAKRNVGILIKNKTTRNKIIDAHKQLKKKPINDVKVYLREHGLLKIGSSCPQDVLRKMYENSILSGDIINNNKELIIHNMLNEDKEKYK